MAASSVRFFLRSISFILVVAPTASPQQPVAPEPTARSSVLAKVAREELASDPALGKQRVSVANGILRVDLSPSLPLGSIGLKDPYGLPLEAMVRAMALLRDFDEFFHQDSFWVKPVQTIEDTARQAIDKGGVTDEASRAVFQDTINEQIEQLAAATRAAANQKHLDIQTSRDPARGYQVKIVIRPPTARVRYMRFLTYLECDRLPLSPEARASCMRDQWNDLNEGTLPLIGRYRYLAAWGKDFGGDEEGTFSITADSVVTLHPPGVRNNNGK